MSRWEANVVLVTLSRALGIVWSLSSVVSGVTGERVTSEDGGGITSLSDGYLGRGLVS